MPIFVASKDAYGRACTLWDNHNEAEARALLAPYPEELERLLARDAAGVPARVRAIQGAGLTRKAKRLAREQHYNQAIELLNSGNRREAVLTLDGDTELLDRLQTEITGRLARADDRASEIGTREYYRLESLVTKRMRSGKPFDTLVKIRGGRVATLCEGMFDELQTLVAPQVTSLLIDRLPKLPEVVAQKLEEERKISEENRRMAEERKRYWDTLMQRGKIINDRGWSPDWIRKFLGEPREIDFRRNYNVGDYVVHFYEIANVLDAEETPEFKQVWARRASLQLGKNIRNEAGARTRRYRQSHIHPLEVVTEGHRYCRLSDRPLTVHERILAGTTGPHPQAGPTTIKTRKHPTRRILAI